MTKYQLTVNDKPYGKPTTLDRASLALTFLQDTTDDKCDIIEVEVDDDT